jgi:hypothetical protein
LYFLAMLKAKVLPKILEQVVGDGITASLYVFWAMILLMRGFLSVGRLFEWQRPDSCVWERMCMCGVCAEHGAHHHQYHVPASIGKHRPTYIR